MATTGGKKRTTKAGGKKRATTRGPRKAPSSPTPPTPETAGAESSVRQALATTQRQIDESLQEIRREMARFQSQVLAAVETVHGEQARELTRVRQAMEGAFHRRERPPGDKARPATARPEEDTEDDPAGAETPHPAPLSAVRAGVETVRHAVGDVARVLQQPAVTPEIDAAIREGVASVAHAVQRAAHLQEGDATREGVESVRAAVAGATIDEPSGPDEPQHESRSLAGPREDP